MAVELKPGEVKDPIPPVEEKKLDVKSPVPPLEEDPEVKKKAEHLANLNKAIEEANETLRSTRKEVKEVKPADPKPEEELEIDPKDPNSKAWLKKIDESASPARLELEKAKDERRTFALRQFLNDKPSLAQNPEKMKAMMTTYSRIKTSTELTTEGILMDLEKAYAAEHSEELINLARQNRVQNAKSDAVLSDIGVTRGATGYSKEDKPKQKTYSDEEKAVLAKWGMTPEQHSAMVSDMEKKVG